MADRIIAVLIGLSLGLIVAVVGAFTIRSGAPGLVLALLVFAAGGVFSRSTGGPWTYSPYLVGTALGIFATAYLHFGEDLILPLDTTTSIWLVGVSALTLAVALLPARWFEIDSAADGRIEAPGASTGTDARTTAEPVTSDAGAGGGVGDSTGV